MWNVIIALVIHVFISVSTRVSFSLYIVLPDGTVVAEHHNPAVPVSVLREIHEWKSQGATMDDVADHLRLRTVPPGYFPHTWHPGWCSSFVMHLGIQHCVGSNYDNYIQSIKTILAGKTEDLKEKLRSILAQFEYQHRIRQWDEKGIKFKTYLYVPEVHPLTNEVFYEREDEAHVLKVKHVQLNAIHMYIACTYYWPPVIDSAAEHCVK